MYIRRVKQFTYILATRVVVIGGIIDRMPIGS